MEEEKAAAYYEELTRKGGGAARFKQGLGFSDGGADNPPPSRASALPTSSFMSSFVKASSPSRSKELEKQSQIESIQNKLKKKDPTSSIGDQIRVSDKYRDKRRDRSSSRSRSRDRGSSRRDRDSSRDKDRDRDRDKDRRRYRSSSRERRRDRRRDRDSSRERRRDRDSSRDRRRDRDSSRDRRRDRDSSRDRRRDRDSSRERGRERKRSRSLSPRKRSERGNDGSGRKGKVVKKEGGAVVDYDKLIHGYDQMTPAEKVKAKMKLQLSQTAEKDEKMGVGSQWERFDFDKDAPIEDEVLEAADDDAAVSKRIGQSFRFASLEGKREDIIRNAHDEAMFGVPAPHPSQTSESEDGHENEDKPTNATDTDQASSLLNEKVISKQQGSWRDRARRNVG